MSKANLKSTTFPRFMADFETLTGKDVLDETYVWASGVCSIDNPYNEEYLKIWNSDEPLYEFLSQFRLCECYFHNLKFDGQFILSYLENHGFVYDEDLEREKSYSTLITGDGQWYMIRVRWLDGEVIRKRTVKRKLKDGTVKEYHSEEKRKNRKSNKRITEFRDSLKKIPLPLKDIPKAYGIPMNKLTIDYTKYRPRNGELTEDEIAYLKSDLQIPALALQNDIIKENRNKLTASADALDDFKSRNPLYLRQTKYKGHKVTDLKLREQCFRRLFPCLDEMETPFKETFDEFCRKSYKGGWTYYKYNEPRTISDGLVFDVNSLYPSVMYECPLPYGKPHYYSGKFEDKDEAFKKDYPLYICHIKCHFMIKKDHLPCIQIKGNHRFGETEYLKASGSEEPVELYLTSVDLKLYQDQYDIEILEFIDGIAFQGKVGIFKDYIDYWSHIKIEASKSGNKGLRSLSKRMLNSLYGKFGTNPESKIKHPYLDDNGIVSFFEEIGEPRESIYTPVASFTTAWARNKTIRSAQCNYDRFYYADTDSIHLSGLEPPLENELFHIHESDLGKWKCEMVFHKAKYVRAKTYLESPYLKDGKVVENPSQLDETCVKSDHPDVKCAGMPENCKSLVTYDNFDYGAEFDGKLMPKRIKGGVVLRETTYMIKKGKIF